MSTASITNNVLSLIKVASLSEFRKSGTVHSLLYGNHTWVLTQQEIICLEKLQLESLHNILHIPTSTPKSLLLAEAGIPPLQKIIDRRALALLWKLLKYPEQLKGQVFQA